MTWSNTSIKLYYQINDSWSYTLFKTLDYATYWSERKFTFDFLEDFNKIQWKIELVNNNNSNLCYVSSLIFTYEDINEDLQ